jgi:hypothetical protein
LPVAMDEEPSKQPGRLLLTLVLLGILGYSGYRVYPPLVDLWQRAREPVEAPAIPPKGESAPQSPNSENTNARPEAQSSDTSQTPAASSTVPASSAANSAPQNTSPPPAASPNAVKASESAIRASTGADKTIATQQPALAASTSPAQSPAHLLESKLRLELAGQPLADKVKLQSTANALTLSGSLTFAEHRDLLNHLRTVPAGVRVIDDVEFTEGPKTTPAPAATGWIWVRSTPPGARILVDGAETGLRTPARLELQTGQHEVRLVRRGFGTAHRDVVVDQGQTMQFTETLENE